MIQKMLDLSTAHITSKTAEAFNIREYFGLIVYDKVSYGWFIHVPDVEDLHELKLPSDLERLINLAIFNKCGWIMLDCDADINNELPSYEW